MTLGHSLLNSSIFGKKKRATPLASVLVFFLDGFRVKKLEANKIIQLNGALSHEYGHQRL